MPLPATKAQEVETKKLQGEELSGTARLAVADALSKARDERAVAVYEDMLVELERTRPNLRAVGALNHLSSFYWDQGKLQEAADVFLRGEKYSSSPEWAAAIRLDAARVYHQMGDTAKRDRYLAEAKAQNVEFFQGMVSYDQALYLLADNNPAAARDLIERDLPTLRDPESRIGPLWMLALAQWQLEDWVKTEVALNEMLKACDAQDNHKAEGVNVLREAAENRLKILREWETKTFELPLKNLVVVRNENDMFHSKVYVHSLGKRAVKSRFKNVDAKLINLTLERQTHSDSGLTISVYKLVYSTISYREAFEVEVFLPALPEQCQSLKIRFGNENGE